MSDQHEYDDQVATEAVDQFPDDYQDQIGTDRVPALSAGVPEGALLSPQQDLPRRLPRLGLRWGLMAALMGGILATMVGSDLVSGLGGDQSGLSVVIGILFVVSLAVSGRQVWLCARERRDLETFWSDRNQTYAPDPELTGATADYLRTLHDSAVRGREAPIDRMLRVLAERMHHPGNIVGLMSNILITLGLIGTIVGLLISVQSLQHATQQLAADPKSVNDAMGLLGEMGNAISGMGVAFYTTLFGAVLGGVVLRILHSQVSSWVELYTAFVAESTDALFAPVLEEQYGPEGAAHRLRQAFGDLQLSANNLQAQLDTLGGEVGFMDQLHLLTEQITGAIASASDAQQAASDRQTEGMEQLGRDLRLLEPVGHAMRRLMGQ